MGADDAPAVVHDRYRVEQFIGEGPFSRVYRATDVQLRLPVALAELLVHRAVRDPDAWEARRAGMLREAEVLAGVRHRNIVAVYDQFADERGNQFLVREYIAGGNLRQLLARTPRQRIGRAVLVAQDLLTGLAVLHRRGVTHGSLDPGSVLLAPPPRPGEPGQAKLTDFGTAQSGKAGDARTDLYAVGAILYEMLMGERFNTDRRPISDRHPATPPALAALLARALAENPADRFAHAEAMERALTQLDLGDAAHITLMQRDRDTNAAAFAFIRSTEAGDDRAADESGTESGPPPRPAASDTPAPAPRPPEPAPALAPALPVAAPVDAEAASLPVPPAEAMPEATPEATPEPEVQTGADATVPPPVAPAPVASAPVVPPAPERVPFIVTPPTIAKAVVPEAATADAPRTQDEALPPRPDVAPPPPPPSPPPAPPIAPTLAPLRVVLPAPPP